MRARGASPWRRTASSLATTSAAAPSAIVEALAAVIVPPASKAGRSPGSDGYDLGAEAPLGDRGLRAAIALRGEAVLRLAANAERARRPLGGAAHVEVVVRVPEAVEDHRVDHPAVAEALPLARLGQEVRRAAHALHPARSDHVRLAEPDRLRRQHHRHQARAADLVHGERPVGRRQACPDPRLPRRRLAEPGGDDVAHDHLLDGGGRHAGALDRRAERRCPELGRGQRGEGAAEAADGGARSADEVRHHRRRP